MIQCDCGCGEQDAYHMWFECAHFNSFLKKEYDRMAAGIPGSLASQWQSSSVSPITQHLLDPSKWIGDQQQRKFKALAVLELVQAARKYDSDVLGKQADIFDTMQAHYYHFWP